MVFVLVVVVWFFQKSISKGTEGINRTRQARGPHAIMVFKGGHATFSQKMLADIDNHMQSLKGRIVSKFSGT